MIQKLVGSIVLTALLAVGAITQAQTTYNWTNAGGGSYHTAGNWSPGGGPPTLIDHSIFNLNNTYTVNFTNAPTLGGDFQVRNGNVTFSYLNPTAFVNWHAGTTSLVGPAAGDAQTAATLNLINMASNPMRGSDLTIGHAAGKVGTMNIKNAQWITYNDDGATRVGQKGTGNLNITTTGTLQNSLLKSNSVTIGQEGGTGNALVSGINSSLQSTYGINVGAGVNSVGTLTVSNGGKVLSGNDLKVGWGSQSNNLVTVDGAGSELSFGSDGLYLSWGAGKGALQVTGGGKVTSFDGDVHIGGSSGGTGILNVSGAGSQFIVIGNRNINVGDQGTGTINISNGGNVTGHQLLIGGASSAVNLNNGTMNLSGHSIIGATGNGLLSLTNGSILNSSDGIALGNLTSGKGTLSILGGSQLTSEFGGVGAGTISGSKATISGAGSKWILAQGLAAGFQSTGEIVVQDQGQVISNGGGLGLNTGGVGIATISGNGSNWSNKTGGIGDSFSVGRASEGILAINTGGSMTSDFAGIGHNPLSLGTASISDSGSKWTVSNMLMVGNHGTGNLLISNAGQLVAETAASVKLGNYAGSTGKFTISGNGSKAQFTTAGSLTVGNLGNGILEVLSGGSVIGGSAIIGNSAGSNGLATVKNAGSNWAAGNSLIVGQESNGELKIENGGSVSAQNIDIAVGLNSTGDISMVGNNSNLVAIQNLRVGGGNAEGGQASLTINNGTTASVGGALTLYSQGNVNLNGGTLQLGSLNDQSGNLNWTTGTFRFMNNTLLSSTLLDKILGPSHTIENFKNLEGGSGTTLTVGSTNLSVDGGKLAGANLTNSGVTSVQKGRIEMTGSLLNEQTGTFVIQNTGLASFAGGVQNNGTFELDGSATKSSGGTFVNNGTLLGRGTLAHAIMNQGTVQVAASEKLLIDNGNNQSVNNNNIQLVGGRLEFTGQLNNAINGFVSGQGTLATASNNPGSVGLVNRGTVAFSGGNNNVYGDVIIDSSGRFTSSGGGVTTFHDDVLHNGVEIRTSANGYSVFLGSVSGAGSFTGTGTVQFEGDLRPGNSPGLLDFEGDVELSPTSQLSIEVAGFFAGSEYDQLAVEGFVSLNGFLDVNLINGFVPNLNDSFTIIDNFGMDSVMGNFLGLAEDALIFASGYEFQISYVGGTGNDVVLTTVSSVPEPNSIALLMIGCVVFFVRRHRSAQSLPPPKVRTT
ncbi:MAG: PEP-CTERM sorting domain-containing protein [Pirellulaceae bacterium]